MEWTDGMENFGLKLAFLVRLYDTVKKNFPESHKAIKIVAIKTFLLTVVCPRLGFPRTRVGRVDVSACKAVLSFRRRRRLSASYT